MSDEVERLFESARRVGGLDYIFTLTRVEGMSFDHPDPRVASSGTSQAATAEAERKQQLRDKPNVRSGHASSKPCSHGSGGS